MGALKLNYNLIKRDLAKSPLFLEKGLKEKGTSGKKCLNYYPFGSPLPGRQLIAGDQYEHGYQGQFTERDEETGLDAFELRMWDSRLARWHSTDPYGQFASPYLGMGNNPISGTDPDGGWNWVGAAIGAGVGGTVGGLSGKGGKWSWGGFAAGLAAGGLAGGLLGDGIANKLAGKPWGAQSAANLGNKLPTGGSGFLAKGTGFVSDKYIASLTTKANNGVGWATRLLPKVMERITYDYTGLDDDFSTPDPEAYSGGHYVPEYQKWKSGQINHSGQHSNYDFLLMQNNNILQSGNTSLGEAPVSPRNVMIKPKGGDMLRLHHSKNVESRMRDSFQSYSIGRPSIEISSYRTRTYQIRLTY